MSYPGHPRVFYCCYMSSRALTQAFLKTNFVVFQTRYFPSKYSAFIVYHDAPYVKYISSFVDVDSAIY